MVGNGRALCSQSEGHKSGLGTEGEFMHLTLCKLSDNMETKDPFEGEIFLPVAPLEKTFDASSLPVVVPKCLD